MRGLAARFSRIDAQLPAESHEGNLEGVAGHRLAEGGARGIAPGGAPDGVAHRSVVAEGGGSGEEAPHLGEPLGRPEFEALDAEAVLGQGARLVRDEHVRPAEDLHARQSLHDRSLARQAQHPDREGERRDHREPLGDRRHGEGDADLEDGPRVHLAPQTDHHHEPADRQRHEEKAAAEDVELHFEGGSLSRDSRRQAGDLADLRPPRCRENQCPGLPADRGRPAVEHIGPLGEDGVAPEPSGALVDRDALAREARLVHGEPVGLDDPRIRRDDVPRPDDEDVARHYRLAG